MTKEIEPSANKSLETSRNLLEARKKLIDYENFLAAQPGAFFGDSAVCPLKHSFAPGIYVREIFIPAGTELTGKIHKHAHPNFLMSGTVRVFTPGSGYETLVGPMAMISPPGTKRGLLAVTDLVWITVHLNPTNTQDLVKLEDEIIAPSFEHYDRFIEGEKKKALESKKSVFTKILNKILCLGQQ